MIPMTMNVDWGIFPGGMTIYDNDIRPISIEKYQYSNDQYPCPWE